MNFEFSEHFKECYRALPKEIQKKVDKAIRLMEANSRHPSLNLEKIDFARDIWSGRVDRNYRFTFQWIPGGVRLRKVGGHQQAYRRP